jgi:hypothetical protein
MPVRSAELTKTTRVLFDWYVSEARRIAIDLDRLERFLQQPIMDRLENEKVKV